MDLSDYLEETLNDVRSVLEEVDSESAGRGELLNAVRVALNMIAEAEEDGEGEETEEGEADEEQEAQDEEEVESF